MIPFGPVGAGPVLGVTTDTGSGNKHKPEPLGGDPAARPAMTQRHAGHINNTNRYGNDPEQLETELSFSSWRAGRIPVPEMALGIDGAFFFFF